MNLNIPLPSRTSRVVLVIGIVCLLASFAGAILVGAHKDDDTLPPIDAPARTRIAEQFGKLPLSFEINKGQIDGRVKFLSHGAGYDLFLTSTDAVLRVQKTHTPKADPNVREGTVLRLKMLGANATPEVEGQDELPGKVNYFTGNDSAKWRRNISTYRRAHFKDVYPGIDLVYYGNQQELEYDLVVAAGANPKLIRFSAEGADQIRLDKTGRLLLGLKHGEVSLNKPVVYQLNDDGSRREVKGAYVVNGNEVRFKLKRFDSSKTLVIDPILSYSTLLGSGANDNTFGIAVDSQGNAYVTGTTDSAGFPTTPGAFKSTSQRGGAFVTKLDPTGSTLIYSSYLGGEGSATGFGIAVDAAGNAHVTGTTTAPDFPIVNGLKTGSAFYKTTDAAANWNNQNTGLAGNVTALAVAPNAPNTIYAASSTGIYRSTDGGATWTKTPSAGLTVVNFATAMAVAPNNSSVVYLGLFSGLFKSTDGGNNWTALNTAPLTSFSIFSIVLDPATPSTVYVGTGNGAFKSTDSGSTWIAQNNFGIPGTPNVRALAIDPTSPLTIYAGTLNNGLFKSTNGGGVWTAMNNGMGGGNPTQVSAIVIDPANPSTIYTGHGSTPGAGGINKSTSGGASWIPLTNGVPNSGVTAMAATSSAVYAAINSIGIIKSTNGGSSWTDANVGLGTTAVNTLVVNPGNAAVLYAGTLGPGFSDAFVTKLNSSGSGLLFSTFLGGSKEETGNGIAIDNTGNIYIAGQTTSSNFPIVNAVRPTVTFNGNCTTGFVTKLNPAAGSYAFSTYLGGGSCDVANSIATDGSGNVYVTGRTSSTDFPTANAFQPALAGSGPFVMIDAFVTKLTTDGALIYSTYLGGGTGAETGFGIAADASGNAYVTGSTTSTDFPTVNPIQTSSGGSNGDVFVTKLNSQGSALVYSTYLAGAGFESGRGIAVDAANNAYVTGISDSADFPLVAGALRTKSPVYKSTDGAAIWSNDNYGLPGDSSFIGVASVSGFAIHPTESSTVYAATGRGVFKTTNGGRTWAPMNNGLTGRGGFALTINPSAPSTLYLVISDLTSNTGVYKSTDGGANWVRRSNGIVGSEIHSLVIDPVAPNTLYVGVSFCCGGAPSRIYKTTDGGDNWGPVGNAPPLVPAVLAVDPLSHLTVYAADAATPGEIYKSIDGGTTWQSLGSMVVIARSITISPHTPGLLYAGTDQAVFKSLNGGGSWTQIFNRAGKIVVDPVSSSTLYLLTNPFSFAPEGLFKSTDGGQTWIPMNKGLNTPQAVALAIDPVKPSTLYLASMSPTGADAFVTKINPAGNSLVYSTFIGGPPNTQNFTNINAQSFGIALDSAGNAYITGLTSATGFPVTPNSFQPFLRGFNDAFISKLGTSYTISGRVLNNGLPDSPLRGAEVVLNDGTSLTSVFTESDGSYQFPRLREGGNYTISANLPHFTTTPVSQTFNNLNSDQVLNFSALISDSDFFTIGGQVTENGAALAGVTVTLSGSKSGLRTTDSNGNYSFDLIIGGNYTVTPSLNGFTFTPSSQTFNGLNANQTANFSANRQSFVVTNANNHGSGSLRDAIINANATLGTDTIVFNIPAPGVQVINLLTPLPEITERVVIDGTTQPGYGGIPLIELDGLGAGSNGHGLVIKAGGSTVRSLAINNFRSNNGIWLNGCDNNIIQGNYIGVAPDGTTAKPNNRGITLSNSSNNVIGGTTAATRNVISGNGAGAIEIGGNGNIVQGNFIGTNAAGTAALEQPGGVSIFSSNFTDNLIGGTAPGAGNLISGNQFGIQASGNNTTIQGNLIGTDVTGTKKIPNGNGVGAFALNVLIGGVTPGARNVISGNSGEGVSIRGAGSKLQGNYIGTDVTGTLALGNIGSGVIAGENALIGGTQPEARNIIAANGNFGNVVLGQNSSGSAATVQGNYIGTDVTGTRALGGSAAGVNIFSDNNIVGGTVAGARNVISGNSIGIQIGGFSSNGPLGNIIQGNFIGLNAAGTGPLPNTQFGISISGGVNNTIGGTQAEAGNKIVFNGGAGVSMSSGNGNAIRGNSIFSNNGLGIDLGVNGVTANDGNDGDTGPNQLQNFPVITSVLSTSNSTTIQGSLKSIPNTTFQIDFFSNAAVDPSGNGEGAQFFHTAPVSTDINGDATINVTVPVGLTPGRVITATATDPNGNTSEFSAADASGTAGSVQFSTASMFVIEDVGTIALTVLRTGGSAGSLTVDYATANGTAIAGQDYTAAAGTLTFNAGETSKTIQVPILDDATTEPDETFTVALNSSNLEAIGAPGVLTVTVQDKTTTPFLSITNASVTEGNAGSTDAVLTINLSAATGRAVSGNYATSNFSAFGGATCGTQGVDYESKSGTFSFQPGTTTFAIPVKVCGDTSAEANETFRVLLSNPSGATFFNNFGTGTIVNDDVLGLILEESGPAPNLAAAIDAYFAVRDPFRVLGIPDWFTASVDKNTRVMFFVQNLQLNPGEATSAVIVRLITGSGQIIDVPAEDVRSIPGTDFTQVVIRLPNSLPAGTITVAIRAHTRTSNSGTIRIVP
jgi:photosystem II stability/assembly factor-like uncharacterized protein